MGFFKSIHPSFSLVFAVKCIEIYYYRRAGIIEIEEKGATIGGEKVNTQQSQSTLEQDIGNMAFDHDNVLDSLSMASMALEAKNRTIERLQEELERLRRGKEGVGCCDLGTGGDEGRVLRDTGEEGYQKDTMWHLKAKKSAVSIERRHSHDGSSTSGRQHSLVLLLQETLDELHTCRATIERQNKEMEILKDRLSRVQAFEREGHVREYYEGLLEEKDGTIAELASMLASQDAFAENVRAFLQQHASSLPSSPTSSIH